MPELEDRSPLARGAASVARGASTAADAVGQMAQRERQQEIAVDLSRAEALRTKNYLDIQNRAADDPDYGKFGETYEPLIGDTVTKAASLIRDERARERWLADNETSKLTMLDAIMDVGRSKKADAEVTALESSLRTSGELIANPEVPAEVRAKARSDMSGSLEVGRATGLLSASTAENLRLKYVEGSDNLLALNIAKLDIATDPQLAHVRLAVPDSSSGGSSVLTAQAQVDGGSIVLDHDLALMTAQSLGDPNFPVDDPELAAAYLSDPDIAEDYAEATQAMLNDRYKGDLTAVVIAMDPNGGTELADRWVESGHKESVLPSDVRKRYRDVMGAMTTPVSGIRIPVMAEIGVDLAGVEPGVLKRWEELQSAFGVQLTIRSGYRDPAHNDAVGGASKSQHINRRALDIDVSALDKDERVRFIEMASAMGFSGIGVYKNSIHLDTGAVRAWGPDYHRGSVPAWAEDAIASHTAGITKPIPSLYTKAAPEYAALTFDQRLALDAQAKAAMNDRDMAMRTSLDTIVTNAPAAIAATGTYDGTMPTAREFVAAYGAADGIQRYRAFEASVDTSKAIHGFQTLPMEDILATVRRAAPVSSGNNAALEAKRYQALDTAARTVRDAREADPAGYAMQAFPTVQAAFEAASGDRSLMPAALNASLEAQVKLGIENPQLLPKGAAAASVEVFKDKTKGGQERIAAVAGTVLQTSDPMQQDMLFRQLVREGLPSYTAGALEAMRRGDTGAAAQLTRAALFDPNDAKVTLPTGMSDTDIQRQVLDDVFDESSVGGIVYGMGAGTADNMEQVAGASELIFRDAKLRLIDGTSSSLPDAVAAASRDLFGDVQVVDTGTARVTIPQDANKDQIIEGFNTLEPTVRSTVAANMLSNSPFGGGSPDERDAFAASGSKNIPQWMTANYVDAVLADGYFANADGGYIFFNPKTGAPVMKNATEPLLFTMADIMKAAGPSRPAKTSTGRPNPMGGY
jgi:hypothetical protein